MLHVIIINSPVHINQSGQTNSKQLLIIRGKNWFKIPKDSTTICKLIHMRTKREERILIKEKPSNALSYVYCCRIMKSFSFFCILFTVRKWFLAILGDLQRNEMKTNTKRLPWVLFRIDGFYTIEIMAYVQSNVWVRQLEDSKIAKQIYFSI